MMRIGITSKAMLVAVSMTSPFVLTGGLAYAQTTTEHTNVTANSILPKITSAPVHRFPRPLQDVYPQFQPPPSSLLMVSPDWCVWLIRDNIPGEERMRAPRYRFRYLIQRWVGEDAICLADFKDTGAPREVKGVSARGSLIFENGSGNTPTLWILKSQYESEDPPVFKGDIHNFSQYTIVYYTFKASDEKPAATETERRFELWATGPFGGGMNGGPALVAAT